MHRSVKEVVPAPQKPKREETLNRNPEHRHAARRHAVQVDRDLSLITDHSSIRNRKHIQKKGIVVKFP